MQKKISILLATALIGTFVLGGCGPKAVEEKTAQETTDATTKETKTEETTDTAAPNETSNDQKEGTEKTEPEQIEAAEIQVFIAASLNTVMTKLAEQYNKTQPDVKITFNADSSGTLLTQIEEGYECDVFFSAAQKQMDQLEKDGLVVDHTRANVVNNQVVLITLKESNTKVTGLDNLKDAASIALAGGSVPVGKYTRQALVNMGILDKVEDVSKITTEQISEKLGGVEISEQANVSKVLIAVTEGSCEVGTTYYSDTYGYEDKVDIIQTVSYDLTGNVIYPICQVKNEEADELQAKAAQDFYQFILSDEAKAVFDSYYFDTSVD
jgi:molybdate transport system substrate-binding protein